MKLHDLYELFSCSELTLRHDLREVGGINSYTHQRSYVTLSMIPKFDENGIWFFRGIGFSKFENSIDLVAHLIASSKTGLTQEQLQEITRIQVNQQIKQLRLREELYRIKFGSKYLYVSEEIAKNKRKRFRLVGDEPVEVYQEGAITTKDLVAVVKVLLLEGEITLKSLKKWVKKHSLKVPLGKLERLITKYKLDEKKTP